MMNSTIEMILEEKLFQKNFQKCDTIEKQIKFCEEFLKKYKPLHVTNMYNFCDISAPPFYQNNIIWLKSKVDIYVEYDDYPFEILQNQLVNKLTSKIFESKNVKFTEIQKLQHQHIKEYIAEIGVVAL